MVAPRRVASIERSRAFVRARDRSRDTSAGDAGDARARADVERDGVFERTGRLGGTVDERSIDRGAVDADAQGIVERYFRQRTRSGR